MILKRFWGREPSGVGHKSQIGVFDGSTRVHTLGASKIM